MNALVWTLSGTAAAVGSLHTLAPDHWMPFAALARSRGWRPLRAARTTILCGFGHVTVSAALGIAALFAGLGVIHLIGGTLGTYANVLLIAFGLVYMTWACGAVSAAIRWACCIRTIITTRTAITITTTG